MELGDCSGRWEGSGRAGLSLCPDMSMAALGAAMAALASPLPPSQAAVSVQGEQHLVSEKRVSRAVSRLWRCCSQYGLGGGARMGKELSLQCRLDSRN